MNQAGDLRSFRDTVQGWTWQCWWKVGPHDFKDLFQAEQVCRIKSGKSHWTAQPEPPDSGLGAVSKTWWKLSIFPTKSTQPSVGFWEKPSLKSFLLPLQATHCSCDRTVQLENGSKFNVFEKNPLSDFTRCWISPRQSQGWAEQGRRVVDVTPGLCHASHSSPGSGLPVYTPEQLSQPDLQPVGLLHNPSFPSSLQPGKPGQKGGEKNPFTRNPLVAPSAAGQKIFSVTVPQAFAKVCMVNYGAEWAAAAPTCVQINSIFLSLWTTTHWWENSERTWILRKPVFISSALTELLPHS